MGGGHAFDRVFLPLIRPRPGIDLQAVRMVRRASESQVEAGAIAGAVNDSSLRHQAFELL
jgi:CRISPR/Cas system-associated protein Csm6